MRHKMMEGVSDDQSLSNLVRVISLTDAGSPYALFCDMCPSLFRRRWSSEYGHTSAVKLAEVHQVRSERYD